VRYDVKGEKQEDEGGKIADAVSSYLACDFVITWMMEFPGAVGIERYGQVELHGAHYVGRRCVVVVVPP